MLRLPKQDAFDKARQLPVNDPHKEERDKCALFLLENGYEAEDADEEATYFFKNGIQISIGDDRIVFIGDTTQNLYIGINLYELIGAMMVHRMLPANFRLTSKKKPMEGSQIFKRYPEHEPNYKGVHFLTITEYNGSFSYSINLYDDDCEWQSRLGKVVAFTEVSPEKIMMDLDNP